MHTITGIRVFRMNCILFVSLLFFSCGKQVNRIEAGTSAKNNLYQYSVIDALLAGVYDGEIDCETLKAKGDFGIGGFNAIDGELYLNEGKVSRIRYDGHAYPVSDEEKAAMAFVTFFDPDTSFTIRENGLTYDSLKLRLGNVISGNRMYAIRISGSFNRMQTRAPAPARKPYKPLAEHLITNQYFFKLDGTRGTMVGFCFPAYLEKVNVPGFHFHYLTEDRQKGGHVLDFMSDSIDVQLGRLHRLTLDIPGTREFEKAPLAKDRKGELNYVEGGE